ncbi:MAG: ATP-binding cassette domain-containing protein [Muribaculaceae bacterium]|nr:ATP-binding cassette domain-containing protein [Muribaculaceae bacterium]
MGQIVKLESDKLFYHTLCIKNPYHVSINDGVTVVVGPNGAGKTTLGNILARGWNFRTNRVVGIRPKLNIKSIEFNDIHSLAGFSVAYYQQRFESMMNDDVPAVSDLFGDRIATSRWRQLCRRLNLSDVETKRINYLSSGELRKLLILNLLYDLPDVLILDNPYIGLDAASRGLLDEAVAEIASRGVAVVLMLCTPSDIPACVNEVIPMLDLTILQPISRLGDVSLLRSRMLSLMDYAIDLARIPRRQGGDDDYKVAFELNNCSVKYGERVILRDLSWRVNKGECWALAGPNGSGKSTLLSLIHADNPQRYCNDITLFDHKRGCGDSIWDIKRRIGYISPEMSMYFNAFGTVGTVIAQGLRDTVGGYGLVTPLMREEALRWMDMLHIEHLDSRNYNTLSAGEKKMVLLARTLIKQPSLLILDEPLHGLDTARQRSVKAVVNAIVERDHTTLIYVTHYLSEVPECVKFTKTLEKLKNV